MRRLGQRIAGADPVLRKPAHGWLEFVRIPSDSYGTRWEARLLHTRGGDDMIPPLSWARVLRIEGVMHLAGIEENARKSTKAQSQPERQSWLCANSPADALPILGRVQLPDPLAFSPEDDFKEDEPFGIFQNRI